MSKWAKAGKNIYLAIDQLKAQEAARNMNDNQTNNPDAADIMLGTFGGNAATMGLEQARIKYGK